MTSLDSLVDIKPSPVESVVLTDTFGLLSIHVTTDIIYLMKVETEPYPSSFALLIK